MKKKPKKSTLKKKCDKLWSQIVRMKYPKCLKCGKPTQASHHIFGRRNLSVRFDIKNGIGLCHYCHTFSPQSFHQSPYSSRNMAVIEYCTGSRIQYAKLRVKSTKVCQMSVSDYQELYEKLKEQYEKTD